MSSTQTVTVATTQGKGKGKGKGNQKKLESSFPSSYSIPVSVQQAVHSDFHQNVFGFEDFIKNEVKVKLDSGE